MSKIKIYCLIANVFEFSVLQLKEQVKELIKNLDENKFELQIYENELIIENLHPYDFFIFISEGENNNLEEFKNFLDVLPCNKILIILHTNKKVKEQQEFYNYLKESAIILTSSDSNSWTNTLNVIRAYLSDSYQSYITTLHSKIWGVYYLGEGKDLSNKLNTICNFNNVNYSNHREYKPKNSKFKLNKGSRIWLKNKTLGSKLRFLNLKDNFKKSAKLNVNLENISKKKLKKFKLQNKNLYNFNKDIVKNVNSSHKYSEELSPPDLGIFFKSLTFIKGFLGIVILLLFVAIHPTAIFLILLYFCAVGRKNKFVKYLLYFILGLLLIGILGLIIISLWGIYGS